MKSFFKEFLINLVCGLIGIVAISIIIGVFVLILTYVSDGILQVVLILLYTIILAALVTTIVNRADREVINKIRGYK